MEDILLDNPVKFDPPHGAETWPKVSSWGDVEWAHWLRQHNKYAFLRQWPEEEIQQYLTVDRYHYGVAFKPRSRPGDPYTWFYNPTPIAVPFHQSKVPNILFGGAAGGSKSHSARWDAIRQCFAIPDFRAIIMRRTFEELKRNHLDKMRSEKERLNAFFDKDVVELNVTDHEVRFMNHPRGHESKIIFGHCQNVGDEEKYLGDAYDAFYPDEMATFDQKQIIGVAGRLRSEKENVTAVMRGTSNPGGAHTLWLKDYFIDHATDKILEQNPRYTPDDYLFIQAMLYDNPYYMDPDGTYTRYENRLFAYDTERRRQLLLGDWTALAGQFFPEFSDARHVAAFNIPEGSRIERWIDWGYDPHYGICLWVAILPNGRLYVFFEWKFNGEHAREKLVASEVAKRILKYTNDDVYRLIPKTRRISKSVADPSMWSGDGHSGEDYATTFRKNGVSLIKADNERILGWGRLRHWFRLAPDGYPWLMIHPRCQTLIRTIPGAVRDKNDPEDIDTQGEDHPLDALRYGVMARPTPAGKELMPQIIIPGSPADLLRIELQKQEEYIMGAVA